VAESPPRSIHLAGARQHNLRSVEVTIPHAALTVITGVSGSGKSSLAHDTLFREGQRRYLASWSSHARARLGKLERPALDRVEGLLPALAVDQRAVVRSPRSTVGTLTELYDHLRLLFARVGEGGPAVGPAPTAAGLSFNSPLGACPVCEGLGVEDRVDPELLIADPQRTLREGALVPTTPTGYIVYSQVTVDVLDRVCGAHGFSVDVPWRELDEEQ
jgi:excinuclease ABC subunit A